LTAASEHRTALAARWFGPALVALSALAALGWVAYALLVDVPRLEYGDARNFHLLADGLAQGAGYVRAIDRVDLGLILDTGEYPPLFPAVLALASLVGLDTFAAHQGVAALVAATAVPLTGLLGRRIGGPAVGLVAAVLVALHPMVFQTGAALMSEALYLPLVVAVLLATLKARDDRSWRSWAVAGVLAGLAALARGEGLVLGAIVAVVAVADLVRRDRRQALVHLAAVAGGLLLVVLPWSVERSFATGGPVLVSANQQTVLAGSNCDATYDGGFRGWWAFSCFAEATQPGETEAERYAELTTTAVDYALERPGDLPGVAAVRALRVWGAYDVEQQLVWESTEGRRVDVQRAGRLYTFALLPFGVAGALALRRRGGPWGLLVSVVAMVTVSALLTYGNQRFRIAAEPALAVLAAVGALALLSRWRDRGLLTVPGADPVPTEHGRPRNERLEGLRAVAALSVMGTHLGFASGATFRSDVGAYLARMDIGVAIFFVLSGYLLFHPFVRADLEGRSLPRLGSYLWRRGLRILPGYWLALLGIPLLLGIDKIRSVGDLVIYGGLLQIYDQDRFLSGITQAWSLCTEISFYLALPLYAAVVRRRGGDRVRANVAGLAVLYIASLAFRSWLQLAEPGIAPIAWAWLPANADLFALGMAVALVEVAGPHRTLVRVREGVQRHGRVLLPAALFTFWVVSTRLGLPRGLEETSVARELVRHQLYGLVGLLAVAPLALSARRDALGAVLGWRPMVWLGVVSYGVYVWHLDVIGAAIGWVDGAMGATSVLELVSVVLPVSVAIAAASWYLVERPLLRFRDAVGRPATAPRPVPAPAATAEDEVVAPAGGVPW
jgi:peptidoglycan/LPS O-acetylase OafA/YrhL/uncharacterized membrane protein